MLMGILYHDITFINNKRLVVTLDIYIKDKQYKEMDDITEWAIYIYSLFYLQ